MSRLLLPVALMVASLVAGRATAQVAESSACPDVDVLAPRADSASAGPGASDSLAGPTSRMRDVGREPVDIAIIASVSAREVRFARQPEIRVRLCGGMDSVRVIERRNLPARIVAGQAYRDVYIAVEILGRVDAACLARRLGVARTGDVAGALPEDSAAGCAAITVGGAASSPAARVPARPAPGTEDAPGAGQVTPVRP